MIFDVTFLVGLHSYITERRCDMVPNDVKELLKTLIADEGLPIDVVDIAPDQKLDGSDYTTECRIKDVIHQWNTDDKPYSRPPGKTEIMKFYTKTDSDSATKELLDSLDVTLLLDSIIAEQEMSIRFSDHGFRLVTLAADDTTRYPVKILHGGIRIEKQPGVRVQSSHLEAFAEQIESILKEKRTKAKLFHRGFRLEKDSAMSAMNMPLSQVKEIAKQIHDTLGINYVLDSYNTPRTEDVVKSTNCTSANICISLWRFPRR